MWLENLKELKIKAGMSSKQIAEKTNLPERTVTRIFSGETDNPYVDTLHRIVTALGSSLNDIFADTKAVVASESLVEAKETATEAVAERDHATTENEELKAKVAELEAKRVPVLSDLTGGGKKEKPVTSKQIMDEWFNGKAEGGEGK
jgi:transcriptional regulator with XRE-family HTH domain